MGSRGVNVVQAVVRKHTHRIDEYRVLRDIALPLRGNRARDRLRFGLSLLERSLHIDYLVGRIVLQLLRLIVDLLLRLLLLDLIGGNGITAAFPIADSGSDGTECDQAKDDV